MKMNRFVFAAAAVALGGLYPGSASASAPIICRGMCDASAVVPVGSTHFIVADDEDNILRVYRTTGGAPVQTFDLSPFIRTTRRSPEADLEASAPLGETVYWITSHARNPDGELRPNRHRFFATKVSRSGQQVSIRPEGQPYTQLLRDLTAESRFDAFNLAEASRREPKSRDALNIEALCATPEGHLLIGFRNPIPDGKALIIPLLNPNEVIGGNRARFGDAILIDLNGMGVRSLTRAPDGYLLVAGSHDGKGDSHLYSWKGTDEGPSRIAFGGVTGLNPEAIERITVDGADRLLIVSDDGNLKIGGKDCKNLKDSNLKYFRATIIDWTL